MLKSLIKHENVKNIIASLVLRRARARVMTPGLVLRIKS